MIRFPSWETLRNGARGLLGLALAIAGGALLAYALEHAPTPPPVREASTTTTATFPRPTLPVPPHSTFPVAPDTAGRSDAALARDPSMRALFRPFAAPGRMNFVRGHRELVETDGASSIAYSWMRAAGQLDRVEDFVRVATSTANDRPRWPQPTTASDWDEATALLALYARLGPIWEAED